MVLAMVTFVAIESLATRESLHGRSAPALTGALQEAQIEILRVLVSGNC